MLSEVDRSSIQSENQAMYSVLDILASTAAANADKVLYSFLDIHGNIKQSYTYREFVDRTYDIASHLAHSASLKPGARVLLVYPPGLEVICAFFACMRLGLIPVPVYPPAARGFQSALYKMTFIAKDSGAEAILTDRAYYWAIKFNLQRKKVMQFNFRTEHISKLKWIITNDAPVTGRADFEEAHSDILFL